MPVIDRVDIEKVGRFLSEQLRQQLIIQGQVSSKRLIDSIEPKVNQTNTDTELLILMAPHYLWVNNGRSGGFPNKSSRPPIQALIDWVINKGLETGEKEVLSAAYAIQTFIWKNGTSQNVNGKSKRDFINNTFDRVGDQIVSMIGEDVFKEFETVIDNFATNATIKLTE